MSPSPGVVLLHGLAGTPLQFRKMDRALQRAGFATLNLGYASRKRSLEALADDIHPAVAGFADSVGNIHFVTHSMGGLLARVYVAQYRPPRLARIVMLGPPNSGSEVADLVKGLAPYRAFFGPAGQQVGTGQRELLAGPPGCAVGIIAGNRTISPISSYFILPRPNDGKVSVASTKLDGMTDHIVLNTSHTLMLLRRDAIAQTIAFLRQDRFEPSPSLLSLRANGSRECAPDDKLREAIQP